MRFFPFDPLLSEKTDNTLTVDLENPVEFTCTRYQVGQHTIVRLGGEVDLESAMELRPLFRGLPTDGVRHLIVDIETVDFLDSSGLNALIDAYRAMSDSGGTFRVVCTRAHLLKLFRLTALHTIFNIHASVDAALAASP